MLEGVAHPYSVCGVKSKQFAHEVEECPVVVVVRDNDLLSVRVKISTHTRTHNPNAPRVPWWPERPFCSAWSSWQRANQAYVVP